MNKLLAYSLSTVLLLASVSATAGGAEPLDVDKKIDKDSYKFNRESQIISFPAIKAGDEVVKYENASYREFASWEAADLGIEKIRGNLKSEFGELRGVQTGNTDDEIELTYIVNKSLERNFSYQEIVAETPSKVEAVISFDDHPALESTAVEVSVPVRVEKEEASTDRLNYALAESNDPRAMEEEKLSSDNKESRGMLAKIMSIISGILLL